jgi:hypothetical protein
MALTRLAPALFLALILAAAAGCSTPKPEGDAERDPAAVKAGRYRSYFGEKLPVHGENAACRKLPENLRSMAYEQFLHLSESRGGRIGKEDARKFARILAFAWSESQGDASRLIDSNGGGAVIASARFFKDNLRREKGDRSMKTTLDSRRTLLTSPRIKQDKKTRLGLFQLNEQELMASAKTVAQWKGIRELAARAPEEAIDRCGTRWMFDNHERELAEAATEAAACVDNSSECLRKWATLCPNLGLALELLSDRPRSRKSKPVCVEAFSSLLKK